jgi:hypothetical protein
MARKREKKDREKLPGLNPCEKYRAAFYGFAHRLDNRH